MSEWMKNILGYLLIVSVTMQILPDKKYEQYVKLFTGAVLLVLILQPLLRTGSLDQLLEKKVTAFVQEQEQVEKIIGEDLNRFQREVENLEQNEMISDETENSKQIEIQKIEQMEVRIENW